MARVIKNTDPKRINQVKVKVHGVGGEKELAWARVLGPVGGNLTGAAAWLPEAGSLVWVMFEQEDINKPVVIGCGWPQAAGKSQIPVAALGEADEVRDARGSDTASGAGGASLEEPDDPAAAEYPFNKVYKDPTAGHLIEIDGTEDAERIAVTHGKTKTWVEFHPDGGFVLGVKGKRYTLVDVDDALHVKGRRDVVVAGEMTTKAGGKMSLTAAQAKALILGRCQAEIAGDLTVKSNLMVIQAAAALNISSVASILMTAPTMILGPNIAPGPVVTTITHPFDYLTGIPILGVPSVLIG